MLFAVYPIIINSKRAVFLSIENSESYCERLFTGARRILIGKVDK